MNNKLIDNSKIAGYFFKLAWKMNHRYILALVFSCICKAATPFINTIVPKYIIEELMGKQNVKSLVWLLLILVISDSILYFMSQLLEETLIIEQEKFMNDIELDIGKKIMNADYSCIEDSAMMDLKEKALFPILSLHALKLMMEELTDIISYCIVAFGMLGLLATLDIRIVILIASFSIAGIVAYKKMSNISFVVNEMIIPINRKFTYYIHMITDYTRAKDIRIYGLEPLISNKINKYNEETYHAFKKIDKKTCKYNIANYILVSVQTILIYIYMIYNMTTLKKITIGQFTMYISALSQFIFGIDKIIKLHVDFSENCEYLKQYIDFVSKLEYEKQENCLELDENIETIQFENVSFKYPNMDSFVLENISFTINKGEKVTIVGTNGAGKTTIVKLLLRLYKPTKGKIFINGINIQEYKLTSYLESMGVVFQDFKIFAFDVKENLCLKDKHEFSDEQIWSVINDIGLEDKLHKSSKGLYTQVLKYFDEEGFEFSGGQAQRLAIGRIIIKDSPILVMDEPTSALDPITESEIFNIFNGIVTNNKIALFISHRLSSCQFSDKVIVINHATIEKIGKHTELLKEDGIYKTMWEKQAQYYL